ncbi:MAG TPA: hypothetical protein VIN07_13745 [Flavipsychrobacter sp.]
MRTALIGLALLISQEIVAQESANADILLLKAYPKNEIGLAGEVDFSDKGFGGPTMIQYKRWARENMAYRINAGVGSYNHFNLNSYFGAVGDTVFEKQTWQRATMAFAGAGVEMQRHFYKRVYLYAVVDLLAGYGSGETEDYLVRRVAVNGQDHTESSLMSGRGKVSVFHINAAPFVGAKIVFNRISFGTEISAINLSYTSKTDNLGYRNNIGDMNMGYLRQRFFINYRF